MTYLVFIEVKCWHVQLPCIGLRPVNGKYISKIASYCPPHPENNNIFYQYLDRRNTLKIINTSVYVKNHPPSTQKHMKTKLHINSTSRYEYKVQLQTISELYMPNLSYKCQKLCKN
jgi:hypothetical protein